MNSIKDRAQAQISAQPRTVKQIAAIVTRSTTATESKIFPFDAIEPFADRAEGMRDGSGSRSMFPSWHQRTEARGGGSRLPAEKTRQNRKFRQGLTERLVFNLDQLLPANTGAAWVRIPWLRI